MSLKTLEKLIYIVPQHFIILRRNNREMSQGITWSNQSQVYYVNPALFDSDMTLVTYIQVIITHLFVAHVCPL